MVKPTPPTAPEAPLRSDPAFSAKAQTFLTWLSGGFYSYVEDSVDFVDERADEALAAATTFGFPSIAGKALNFTRVNAGATALEFRTPAQVRSDIGAAYSQSLSENGYVVLPGGLIMQWGMIITGNDVSGAAKLTVTGTLPITFPTAGFQILGTLQDAGTGGAAITSAGFLSSSTYEFLVEEFKSVAQSIRVRFIAIGH
jgi:hypothetical protein